VAVQTLEFASTNEIVSEITPVGWDADANSSLLHIISGAIKAMRDLHPVRPCIFADGGFIGVLKGGLVDNSTRRQSVLHGPACAWEPVDSYWH